MDWEITVGNFQLIVLAGVEIHKSVDLPGSTCTIDLPGSYLNRPFKIPEKIKRGDPVKVRLGYNGQLGNEWYGFLSRINTDQGALKLECEDALLLFRVGVKDKTFLKTDSKPIAQYLIDQTGAPVTLQCDFTLSWDKFVIHDAQASDVLQKIREQGNANIYFLPVEQNGKVSWELHIHPMYAVHYGDVAYSFQQNIEKDNLKYVHKEDKKVHVQISTVGADGKKKVVEYGDETGEKVTREVSGLGDAAMKDLAKSEYNKRVYDGFEGDITGWLIPETVPGDTVHLSDEDYPEKKGAYYVNAVTTTFDESGGARKAQLGIKLS